MGDFVYKIPCAKCGNVIEHDTREYGIWLGIGSEVQCPRCGAVMMGVLDWKFYEMKPLPPPKVPKEFVWPIGQEKPPKKKKRH